MLCNFADVMPDSKLPFGKPQTHRPASNLQLHLLLVLTQNSVGELIKHRIQVYPAKVAVLKLMLMPYGEYWRV